MRGLLPFLIVLLGVAFVTKVDFFFYLLFPFTGAQPQREAPYNEYVFNLRASYRDETAGLVENFHAIYGAECT